MSDYIEANGELIQEDETSFLMEKSSQVKPALSPQSDSDQKTTDQLLRNDDQDIFQQQSPSKRRFADLLLSPVRYTQRKFRPGGTSGSIFSLVAATLGAGTITFPYAIMMNGIVWGSILIVLGALISYYTGMLLVKVSNHTSRHRYEDMADFLYGKRMSLVTSVLNFLCLAGFVTSFIVFIKSTMPQLIMLFTDDVPEFIGDTTLGQFFWGTIFSFGVLFPLSIPRSINALRYSSTFGVFCSVYLCIAVTIIFWTDKTLVPDPLQRFKDADYFKFSFNGIVSTVPLIIFAYMYQMNIPAIYHELEKRNQKKMSKILLFGTGAAIFLYILVGIFGYLTFSNNPEALESKNILEAPYNKNVAISIGKFGVFFAVLAAAPICVLPAKDTVEELFWKGKGMTRKINLLVTLGIVFLCYGLAIFIPAIGDAITISGATTNPLIGFIIPVVLYWKVKQDLPLLSFDKIISLLIVIIIIIASILGLINFAIEKSK